MESVSQSHTVDGKNPENSPVEGKVAYPIIYKVFYIQPVVGLGISEPSTVFLDPSGAKITPI